MKKIKLSPYELHNIIVLFKTGVVEIEKENFDVFLSNYEKKDRKFLQKQLYHKIKK